MYRTKEELVSEFEETILPYVKAKYEQDRRIDYPARRGAWNDWLDSLCKDRQITERQANYACPW